MAYTGGRLPQRNGRILAAENIAGVIIQHRGTETAHSRVGNRYRAALMPSTIVPNFERTLLLNPNSRQLA